MGWGVTSGKSNAAIVTDLNISVETVKTMQSIPTKSRRSVIAIQLEVMAFLCGLIDSIS